jgi:hypothetical protein
VLVCDSFLVLSFLVVPFLVSAFLDGLDLHHLVLRQVDKTVSAPSRRQGEKLDVGWTVEDGQTSAPQLLERL